MTSNVALRSNVQLGSLADLGAGGSLLGQIRGRSGLVKLLERLEPGRPERDAARLHLQPDQIAELYQDACSDCGFFTVGPARTPEGPVLQVRCPRGRCKSFVLPTKELLLDSVMIELIRSAMLRNPGDDLSGLVAKSLSDHTAARPESLGTVVSRAGIRLAPTLYYRFYTWPDRQFAEGVKARLNHWVKNG